MDDVGKMDLNWLRALGHLLETSSVSAAARRAGIGQPAMSRTLAQLRRWFHDPLLVQVGRSSVLSERAQALRPRVQDALRVVHDALNAAAPFDPAQERFEAHIAANDYSASVFLEPWVRALRSQAPGLTLHIEAIADTSPGRVASGELDFVVGPAVDAARLKLDRLVARPLWRDRYVCAMRRDHPCARGKLTLARYLEHEHLLARCGHFDSVVDAALARRGQQRKIAVAIPSFLLAATWLERNTLLATLPERLLAAQRATLELRPLPFKLPDFTMYLAWRPLATGSPRHRWLRSQLMAVPQG